MKKYLPMETVVDDDSFVYTKDRTYPEEILRSSLFSPGWGEIDEETGKEVALLMDYDGFIEWFNSNLPAWIEDLLDEDCRKDFSTYTAEEYLADHLGYTIFVAKEETP